MTLPSPETMLTYASILRKERRDKDGLAPPGEIALAAAEALEHVVRNINADSALAGQLAQAMQENGRLKVALAQIRDTKSAGQYTDFSERLQQMAADAIKPQHHDFTAVGLTTDKPASGGI